MGLQKGGPSLLLPPPGMHGKLSLGILQLFWAAPSAVNTCDSSMCVQGVYWCPALGVCASLCMMYSVSARFDCSLDVGWYVLVLILALLQLAPTPVSHASLVTSSMQSW